jgi:hypothetical protein
VCGHFIYVSKKRKFGFKIWEIWIFGLYIMEKKLKAFDYIKWIFMLPVAILLAEITSGLINKLIDFIEIYLFGKDFFQYYWSLFCVAMYGAIYGFFLSAATYLIAPNHKKRSSYIILAIMLFITLLGNSDFSNEYFYIRLVGTLIIGVITPGILEENKQESFIATILTFLGLLIVAIWIISSLVLHIWTVKLVYHDYGSFIGFCSIFLPLISEFVYLFKLWNAHDGYVKLFFLVLIFNFIKHLISKILS